MKKKVRFNDNVEVKEMSIDLNEHRKEVKSPKDIIINPDKIVPNIEKANTKPDMERDIGYKDKMFGIPYTRNVHDPPHTYKIFGVKATLTPGFFTWTFVGLFVLIVFMIFYVTNLEKNDLRIKK